MRRELPIALTMVVGSLAALALAQSAARGAAGTAPTTPTTMPVATDFTAAAAAANSTADAETWSFGVSERLAAEPPLARAAGSAATSRPQELASTPMAPLPSGLLIAPVGLLVAAWMMIRIKRRRGVI